MPIRIISRMILELTGLGPGGHLGRTSQWLEMGPDPIYMGPERKDFSMGTRATQIPAYTLYTQVKGFSQIIFGACIDTPVRMLTHCCLA